MTAAPLLCVQDLTVEAAGRVLLSGIGFTLERGQSLAIVGESGAGKSLAVRAVCGLLPQGLTAHGSVRLDGEEMLAQGARWRRGRGVLYLSQQAMRAFEPLSSIGRQLSHTIAAHFPDLPRATASLWMHKALSELGFADPESVLKSHPSELSGGMLQRAMLSVAMILHPEVIVADEPTSALDALAADEVVRIVKRIQAHTGSAVIVVTHDLAFARSIAGRFLVMRKGGCEALGGPEIFTDPRHAHACHLMQMQSLMNSALCDRDKKERPVQDDGKGRVFLEVKNLTKTYRTRGSFFWKRGPAREVLRGVSLDIHAGEVVGLIGRSGEGKSTLSRLLLGLEAPASGTIRVEGMALADWQKAHPAGMSVVSQNYVESADPFWTVADVLKEPLQIKLRGARGTEREELLAQLSPAALLRRLAEVGLGKDVLDRRPRELSGGELQRVCIARALAAQPRFVVFDEALSSLDASVQGEVLELLKGLVNPCSAWLFITHDIRAAAALCDRICFLHDGVIVEEASRGALTALQHPAAKALVAAAMRHARAPENAAVVPA